MIQNTYFRKYITRQCSKLSDCLSSRFKHVITSHLYT